MYIDRLDEMIAAQVIEVVASAGAADDSLRGIHRW